LIINKDREMEIDLYDKPKSVDEDGIEINIGNKVLNIKR
jgi:hypothetical protein